jgi:hypothetical protein
MITNSLLAYCMLLGGGFLLIFSLLYELIGRGIKINRFVPKELLEISSASWFFVSFLMDFLFFVVIPTFAYYFFFLIVPLSGIRLGLAVALTAFTIGMLPFVMSLSIRIRLSVPWLIFFLLGQFLKLAGTLTIIGYLYSL